MSIDTILKKDLTPSAIKFAKDYWDVGTSFLAGVAYNDTDSMIFGPMRWPVFFGGIIASAFSGANSRNSYRGIRNLLSGFSGVILTTNDGMNFRDGSEIVNYSLATLMAGMSYLADRSGRRELVQ